MFFKTVCPFFLPLIFALTSPLSLSPSSLVLFSVLFSVLFGLWLWSSPLSLFIFVVVSVVWSCCCCCCRLFRAGVVVAAASVVASSCPCDPRWFAFWVRLFIVAVTHGKLWKRHLESVNSRPSSSSVNLCCEWQLSVHLPAKQSLDTFSFFKQFYFSKRVHRDRCTHLSLQTQI